MGLTTVTALVGKGKHAAVVDFLVDSGATYTVLPKRVWQRLSLKPVDRLRFSLADGTIIERDLSEVWLEYAGRGRTVQVVLGEAADEPLLGALSLEALGLVLNPFTRELLPMRLLMARSRPS